MMQRLRQIRDDVVAVVAIARILWRHRGGRRCSERCRCLEDHT